MQQVVSIFAQYLISINTVGKTINPMRQHRGRARELRAYEGQLTIAEIHYTEQAVVAGATNRCMQSSSTNQVNHAEGPMHFSHRRPA
jgi:hypothetical protein